MTTVSEFIKKFNILLSLFLCMPAIALANPTFTSSVINFGGGVIQPTKAFKLPLSKLVENIFYDVTCQISNNTKEPITFSVVGEYSYFPFLNLNGESFQIQARLQPGINQLEVKDVSRFMNTNYIILTNGDQQQPLTVEVCIATAQ